MTGVAATASSRSPRQLAEEAHGDSVPSLVMGLELKSNDADAWRVGIVTSL